MSQGPRLLFTQAPQQGVRLVFLILLSVGLAHLDQQYNWLSRFYAVTLNLRYGLLEGLEKPVVWTATWLERWRAVASYESDKIHWQQSELALKHRIQQLEALQSENDQLRFLLHVAPKALDSVQVAQWSFFDPDPFQHYGFINKGRLEGISLNQTVMDGFGVMGKVVQVGDHVSRVCLLTHIEHAIPVESKRTGLRAIALGKGILNEIQLQYVPLTADVRVGDEWVTSGVGGQYPRGYLVGEVVQVTESPQELFSGVVLKPSAALGRSPLVLIVQSEGREGIRLP